MDREKGIVMEEIREEQEMFEANETEATMDDFLTEQDEATGIDPKLLVAGAAAVIGGGAFVAKKFGGNLKAKAEAVKKARLEKKQAKKAEELIQIQAKLDEMNKSEETVETTEE